MQRNRFQCPSCGTLTNSIRCPSCGTDTEECDAQEEHPTREDAYTIFDHAQQGHTDNIRCTKRAAAAQPSIFQPRVSIELWETPLGHRSRVRITRDAQGFGKVSQLGDL